jgi:hypothetical protein
MPIYSFYKVKWIQAKGGDTETNLWAVPILSRSIIFIIKNIFHDTPPLLTYNIISSLFDLIWWTMLRMNCYCSAAAASLSWDGGEPQDLSGLPGGTWPRRRGATPAAEGGRGERTGSSAAAFPSGPKEENHVGEVAPKKRKNIIE